MVGGSRVGGSSNFHQQNCFNLHFMVFFCLNKNCLHICISVAKDGDLGWFARFLAQELPLLSV